MGVSAGDGMIHYVLLTRDSVGRSIVDTRVIDVDPSDGLDAAGRVNAGIDLMLNTARGTGLSVGPIGVAARTVKQRRELRSGGTGPRRQIHLVSDDEAVVAYLSASGYIGRFDTVVVVDCGDTGMSLYTVDTATQEITAPERSRALAGRQIDRAIVARLSADDRRHGVRSGRAQRRNLLSAGRTAKEEVARSGPADPVLLADGGSHVTLGADTIDAVTAPMVDDARKILSRYLSEKTDRRAPEAVVLVGGIANLPGVRRIVDDPELAVVVPETPELASSIGAAILARATTSAGTPSRLAFIGGRTQREWLSARTLAVAGAVLAAALMTIYAISSSVTRHESPAASPTPETVTSMSGEFHSAGRTTVSPTRHPAPVLVVPDAPAQSVTPAPTTTYEVPRWGDGPAWATTELPPTEETSDSPSTTTRTLSPYPMPSLPWPHDSGQVPTIPPGLLPPGLAPETTQVTPQAIPGPDDRGEPTTPSSATPVPNPTTTPIPAR
ncbi:hypothetical protein [Gordonia rhizosphera]|uniref:Chaperone protein n=1 Tax=Gordonia rhizosphera NBRC 16068 TaxID=1108045 RepID=K6W980_9ACTN|nr:hypothetical protein [Gordonia rhizosphera]GAB88762.1 hypothetical protein GORHZ_039_00090 [Gordonia rhizosphera NBRC 16068]